MKIMLFNNSYSLQMDDITIRRASTDDVSQLQQLNDDHFGEVRDYANEIASASTAVFVAIRSGEIVAITGLKHQEWNNTAWVLNIFVLPQLRQRGVGTKIMQHILLESKKLKVRCVLAEAPTSSQASHLFKKVGFRYCGYNDRYYDNTGHDKAEFYSFDLNSKR